MDNHSGEGRATETLTHLHQLHSQELPRIPVFILSPQMGGFGGNYPPDFGEAERYPQMLPLRFEEI